MDFFQASGAVPAIQRAQTTVSNDCAEDAEPIETS